MNKGLVMSRFLKFVVALVVSGGFLLSFVSNGFCQAGNKEMDQSRVTLDNKAPLEGVKEFTLGPPIPNAPPKNRAPDRLRGQPSSAGAQGGKSISPASGSIDSPPPKAKKQTKAPKEMQVISTPLPPDKIPAVKKNLPATFYPHEPRTLPTRRGEVSPEDAAVKEKKRRGGASNSLSVEGTLPASQPQN